MTLTLGQFLALAFVALALSLVIAYALGYRQAENEYKKLLRRRF
jgi:hypothetical protein